MAAHSSKMFAANSDIESIYLYNNKSLVYHGYVLPFIIIYALWTYISLFVFGFQEHSEAGFIGFAIIGSIQVLTCLLCHWFIGVRCLLTCRKEVNLTEASVVKVVPTANNGYPELVRLNHTKSFEHGNDMHWFIFQKITYTFDVGERNCFVPTKFPVDNLIKEYVDWKGYQSDRDIKVATEDYGTNNMAMDIPKFAELFKERATAPFFAFQVFCVTLWCLDEYWYYSVFTLLMLVVFEGTLVQQQLRNMAEIRKMGNMPFIIQVYRHKKWSPFLSDQLIPGDIVSIGRPKNDQMVPCDLLLLRGPCIVDESMLTGESVPVMKEPADTLPCERALDFDSDSKLHVLFGGTKIVQHTPPPKSVNGLKAPDNGCIAYVLRTGFNTSQGRLLKTILYSVKRVTANNVETFLFILFLLIFAVAASAYVWIKGTEDPRRNRYKLFLECTLILTSVVPPELPIELSLAVNSSLIALSKLYVYCTEPFRIPFAGKVDICCFDKTGTLTRDEMVVEGIAGLNGVPSGNTVPVTEGPLHTIQVLVTCHSLVQLEHDLVGDPLEKAILRAADWTLTKGEAVIPRSGPRTHPLKIFHRFHFSSSLQRMSVIAGHTQLGSVDTDYVVCVKGSPEALKPMFKDLPADYDATYLAIARRGSRVLALGYKSLGRLTHQQVRDARRDDMECDLEFCGFVVISCPLKSDSKSAVAEILHSSHHVNMITGDNPLTGCHVSRELRIIRKDKEALVLTPPNQLCEEWHWQSVDDSVMLPWKPPGGLRTLTSQHDLCMTGAGLTFLERADPCWLRRVMPAVKVYARVAPKQKEQVITGLKELGYITLMCGDGTNDVGALKHAHVGVALLSNAPDSPASASGSLAAVTSSSSSSVTDIPPPSTTTGRVQQSRLQRNGPPSSPSPASGVSRPSPGSGGAEGAAARRLANVVAQMEEEEKAQVVRLGDASIAAPFTVKMVSVTGVCHIIKQGRCTLVTTLQMFKILALNALVLAYSQSVLYLQGVKFSDGQATLQALLLAGCFLFISRSKPLKVLSRRRPLPNIFNVYTLLTLVLQFAVHFWALYTLTTEANIIMPPRKVNEYVDIHADFEPNLLNSIVYLISIGMQITTFAVNYKGHPFMESLMENRPLLYSLCISSGALALLASGLFPEFAEQFKLVPIPDELRSLVLKVMAVDFVASLVIDRILDFLLGRGRLKGVH